MEHESRTETDSFGSSSIPIDAYYGIRTARCLALSCSNKRLSDYPDYINSLVYIKSAAARANLHADVFSNEIQNLIEEACSVILRCNMDHHFPVDVTHGGGGIAINMNINEVIANIANERAGQKLGSYTPVHPKSHVNASQSTADVCQTALKITILKASQDLIHALDSLQTDLEQKAQELKDVKTLARTCLQDAMPVSLGSLFDGYRSMIQRRTLALKQTLDALKFINLSGTVIGSGEGAPEPYRTTVVSYLNELCEESFQLKDNLYDAAQNIDECAALSSQLALQAECCIKIAQDLRLLASGPEGGFSEIQLPSVQEGSSFFPNKINPVIPETVIQCCFQIIGLDRTVQACVEKGELYLNIYESFAGFNIIEGIQLLDKSIRIFSENCIKGIQVNHNRCKQLSEIE